MANGKWTTALMGVLGITAGTMVAGCTAASTPTSQGSATTTTATNAPASPVSQWTKRYGQYFDALAEDGSVVLHLGQKAENDPIAANVNATTAACNKWGMEAHTALVSAPSIPSNVAQENWSGLISASALSAADCATALSGSNPTGATDFTNQLTLVNKYEEALLTELGLSK